MPSTNFVSFCANDTIAESGIAERVARLPAQNPRNWLLFSENLEPHCFARRLNGIMMESVGARESKAFEGNHIVPVGSAAIAMYQNVLAMVIITGWAIGLAAAELPTGATLLDGDLVWEKSTEPTVIVSPDGKSVAYLSKGAIWLCSVDGGPPKKLVDLQGTLEEFLAQTGTIDDRGQEWKIRRNMGNGPFNQVTAGLSRVESLQWRRDGDALIYVLAAHAQSNVQTATYQIFQVSINGSVTKLGTIERDASEEPHALTDFHLRADKKYIVATGFSPLIWNMETNKPQVTPFDYLIPSSTSDRYLGIEIDTRQLVLVDENFKIAKRFDVTFDRDRQCDLIWSPDERLAICRSFRGGLEPISDKCSIFRIDLESGKRRDLKPGFGRDRFVFSGSGEEILRIGVVGVKEEPHYGDGTYGSYMEFVPDGENNEHELYRFGSPGDDRTSDWHQKFYPAVVCNKDCSLLALARPRLPGEKPGFHYCLMDRGGHTWPFWDGDTSNFISPCVAIAFVDGGQTLLAHDDSRLFSIPVATIKKVAEEAAK